MKSFFSIRYEELPEQLPIFPLGGVILLPHGRYPLTIFEPRYLQLVFDALATPERMIGMVLPQLRSGDGRRGDLFSSADEEAGLSDTVPVYSVGCAGRITSMSETEDNRLLIGLDGVIRFRIAEELPFVKAYRRVRPQWSDYRGDMVPEILLDQGRSIDRKRLILALKRFFSLHGIEAEWEAIEHTTDARLVTSLSMICPFEDIEKQALLESDSLITRAELLTNLLEMAALTGDSPESLKH